MIDLLDDGVPEVPSTKWLRVDLQDMNGHTFVLPADIMVEDREQGVWNVDFYPEMRQSFTAAALSKDGKLIVSEFANGFENQSGSRLLLLDERGLIKRRLPVSIDGTVQDLRWFDDGGILIVATSSSEDGFQIGDAWRHGLARLSPDGSLDLAFEPAVNELVRSARPMPDGRVLVMAGNETIRLIRLKTDGSIDSTFQPIDRLISFVVEAQNRIVAVYSIGRETRLGRFLPDGSPDPMFGSGSGWFSLPGGLIPDAFGLDPSGAILVPVYDPQRPRMLRLREDGSEEDSFELPMDAAGYARYMFVEENGNLVVGSERQLYHLDGSGKILQVLSLKAPNNTDMFDTRFLGVWQETAILQDRIAAWGNFADDRLLRIPFATTVTKAVVIDPNDLSEWRDLMPLRPLPTEVLAGREKRVRVQRIGDVRGTASVTVSTRDLTAIAGIDYMPIETKVDFVPLETEKSVFISVQPGSAETAEKKFEIVLANAHGVDTVAPPLPIRIVPTPAELRLRGPELLANGLAEVRFNWQAWMTNWLFQLDVSEDLRTWTRLEEPFSIGYDYSVSGIDPGVGKNNARFYRLLRRGDF
jgi:hypothetical protein